MLFLARAFLVGCCREWRDNLAKDRQDKLPRSSRDRESKTKTRLKSYQTRFEWSIVNMARRAIDAWRGHPGIRGGELRSKETSAPRQASRSRTGKADLIHSAMRTEFGSTHLAQRTSRKISFKFRGQPGKLAIGRPFRVFVMLQPTLIFRHLPRQLIHNHIHRPVKVI